MFLKNRSEWARPSRRAFFCGEKMKLLKTYLWQDYKKESILAPLFKLLEAFFDLLVPLVVAQIIDVGIKHREMAYVGRETLVLLGLALLGLGASIVAQYFAAKASVGCATQVRQASFDHIEQMSYAQLDNIGSSTLITRLTSDVNEVQTGLNLALRLLLRSPFVVFGSMVLAFTINFRCALVFVVAIPLLLLVVFGIMLASIPLFRKVQYRLDAVTQETTENLAGVRVIRAFRKESAEVRDFDAKNDALTHLNIVVGRLSAALNPLTYAMINIATIILIQQGALQVNIGALQQGQVVALYNYMAQMIIELIKLASLIITINRSIACGQRLKHLLALPAGLDYSQAETNVTTNTTGEVAMQNVEFSYPGGGAPALTGVNFKAQSGQTIGIIGGTGAGKSTLVNLLPRFYDATKGQVLIDGVDVKDYPKGQLIKKFGVVPQKAQLFAGSVRENMRWGNDKASDEDIWAALRQAQVADVVEKKEGQLDFAIEQNGENLSGGQKQRLTIARALAKKPEFLILDDSASALDFATDAALRQALARLKKTTFIVSQRAASIMRSDQIIVLDNGAVAGIGKHDDLMQTCPIYQEIFYSQFPEKRPAKEAD
jgi:ATP-binding cassette subfamily B multidrug efflux pump